MRWHTCSGFSTSSRAQPPSARPPRLRPNRPAGRALKNPVRPIPTTVQQLLRLQTASTRPTMVRSRLNPPPKRNRRRFPAPPPLEEQTLGIRPQMEPIRAAETRRCRCARHRGWGSSTSSSRSRISRRHFTVSYWFEIGSLVWICVRSAVWFL